MRQREETSELLLGTLDMLILRARPLEPMHGFGLSARLAQMPRDLFQVAMDSLYPAPCRLKALGWLKAKWSVSENNRPARFHEITAAGRRQFDTETETWALLSSAINAMLRAT